jgi:hypothetical protein
MNTNHDELGKFTYGKNIIENEKEKTFSDRELKMNCLEYAKTMKDDVVTNTDTGNDIKISNKGIQEWFSKSKSREQILSIKQIKYVLKNAKYNHSEPDKKGRKEIEGFDYYNCDVTVNGKPFNVVLSIMKNKVEGHLYYHHYLDDIEIKPVSSIPPGNTSNALLLTGSTDNIPPEIKNVKEVKKSFSLWRAVYGLPQVEMLD